MWDRLVACRPIVNRPLAPFASSQGGRLTIGRRLPACPTLARGSEWVIGIIGLYFFMKIKPLLRPGPALLLLAAAFSQTRSSGPAPAQESPDMPVLRVTV